MPENTTADAEQWAAGLTRSGYAIDDETAIKVVDGFAEVISPPRCDQRRSSQ